MSQVVEQVKAAEIILEKKKENKMVGKTINISTHLMGKEEVFQIMALAHAAKLPLLLVGVPGVAKTNTVLDYAASSYDLNTVEGQEEYEKAVYILETDEGTKSAEVKGRLNMREFVQNQNWVLNTPIADAHYVVVNEIDKASSGMRNSLLGVMNEKLLFNGESKVPCKWNLFVATCNEIPKDEVGSPFWDRFILKMTVGRMSNQMIQQYYAKGDKSFANQMSLYIPSEAEIKAVKIPAHKLKIFLDEAYDKLSDRTLTYLPKLIKIATLVYKLRIDAAIVKVAGIMIGETTAAVLSKKLITPEMKTIYDKIDMIPGITDKDHYENVMDEIKLVMVNYRKGGKLNEDQIKELQEVLTEIEQNSPFGVELIDDTE